MVSPPSHTPQPVLMATTGTAANGDMLVTLVSSEGEKFELPRKIAEMSELVKGMIQERACRRFF